VTLICVLYTLRACNSHDQYAPLHTTAWIDLIFGASQRGIDAEAALNVFYYLTYHDADVDIDAIADPVLRQATIEQIRDFGQTPAQLFDKALQPRTTTPRLGALYTDAARLAAAGRRAFAFAVGDFCDAGAPDAVNAIDKLLAVGVNHAFAEDGSILGWKAADGGVSVR
jgi:hypothetical protein